MSTNPLSDAQLKKIRDRCDVAALLAEIDRLKQRDARAEVAKELAATQKELAATKKKLETAVNVAGRLRTRILELERNEEAVRREEDSFQREIDYLRQCNRNAEAARDAAVHETVRVKHLESQVRTLTRDRDDQVAFARGLQLQLEELREAARGTNGQHAKGPTT